MAEQSVSNKSDDLRSIPTLLKSYRKAVQPRKVDILALPPRRRVRGLTQEEVALLAGIGAETYAHFERGNLRLSLGTLKRVCVVLQVPKEVCSRLFSVVRGSPSDDPGTLMARSTATLTRALESFRVPALAMNLVWDVLAWNNLLPAALGERFNRSSQSNNLLRILLTDAITFQHDIAYYESTVRRLVARFRIDSALSTQSSSCDALAHELGRKVPLFREMWMANSRIARGKLVLKNPRLDVPVEYGISSMFDQPDLRVVALFRAPQ